jgi:hypothetical protein
LDDTVDGGPPRDQQGLGGADLWDRELKPWKVDTFKISTDPHFEASWSTWSVVHGPAGAGGGVQLR